MLAEFNQIYEVIVNVLDIMSPFPATTGTSLLTQMDRRLSWP